MAMNMTSSSGFAMMSPHRAVLEASPTDDDGKLRLLEELRSRGRAAVGAKSWMDAKLLYEKCLSLADGCSASSSSSAVVDRQQTAIFRSNLSLVENSMGEFEKARVAAEDATRDDPKYVKAWWRLGQALLALHRPKDALDAFSRARALDPTNKALAKLVQKTKKQVEEEAALMMMEVDEDDGNGNGNGEEKTKKSTTKSIPAPPRKSTTTTTTTSTQSSSSSSADNDNDNDEDDSKLFTKSEPIRGYKVVNGKKTSYFHNELDEKSKELIGDIAPKKIENPASNPTNANAAAAASKQGTSVWNTGGTWEEKNVTEWATTTLTELLLRATYTLPASSPAPGASVTVSKVSKLDGHASVAVVRGKTRFIYEFGCELDWQLDKKQSDGNDDDDDDALLNCKGSLSIPDIDGTIAIGEGYEIHDFVIDSVSNPSLRPVVDRFVHRGGFHEALNERIDDWVRRFKTEYGPKEDA